MWKAQLGRNLLLGPAEKSTFDAIASTPGIRAGTTTTESSTGCCHQRCNQYAQICTGKVRHHKLYIPSLHVTADPQPLAGGNHAAFMDPAGCPRGGDPHMER